MQTKHQKQTWREYWIIRLGIENNDGTYARALMDKVDSLQEQMNNVSREVEILRKNQEKSARDQKH